MKKLIVIFLVLPLISFSQTYPLHDQCGTQLMISKAIAKNPKLESLIFEFEKDMQTWIANNRITPPVAVKSHFLDSILTIIQLKNNSNQRYTKEQLYRLYPEYFKRKESDLKTKEKVERMRKKERNEN